MRILSVLFTVFLTLLTSIILKQSSGEYELFSLLGISIIILVFLINLVKFVTWGWLNKHYDLSKTYPLTAIFFPLIFIYAVIIGDTSLTIQKISGLIIILAGLYLMETAKEVK